jgi:hypothetical protein
MIVCQHLVRVHMLVCSVDADTPSAISTPAIASCGVNGSCATPT